MNVPWQIFAACTMGDTVDVYTYQALHTTIDLAGLYDLLEIRDVRASWESALMWNAEHSQ